MFWLSLKHLGRIETASVIVRVNGGPGAILQAPEERQNCKNSMELVLLLNPYGSRSGTINPGSIAKASGS